MAKPHYNDPDYRAARRWLTAHPETRCWFDGCTELADTIDHDPPITSHTHRRGAGCCQLKPACRQHNCSHGATIGNKRRASGYDWP
jgi:hypothetical protein